MEKYEALKNNSIILRGNKIIYIDPYDIDKKYNDADYIFITHSHYDHLSIVDIQKVINEKTFLITVKSGESDLKNAFPNNKIIIVEPNKKYKIEEINFETTNAYNINKNFHPKENNWVGYLIEFDELKYYIAGDTDFVDELKNIKCDIAFLPIGGKYTMDYEEAAKMANIIEAKIVIPTHYSSVIGSIEDAYKFKNSVIEKEVKIQIK